MEPWPFADIKNAAVVTLRSIMQGDAPVLHVTHDREDGWWQFLGWEGPRTEDAMLVCLEEIVALDPSLAQLADLPLGWHAWRTAVDQPWMREPKPRHREGVSEMENERTFAYLLVASAWSTEIEAEIDRCYWGDVLELFFSREEQAETPDNMWGFGWDAFMSRVAPGQLTYGWDPRPYLLAVFDKAGVEPRFKTGDGNETDNILYFDRLPSDLSLAGIPAHVGPNPDDRTRFEEVLAATVELARTQQRGVLFIGGWGCDYEADAEYLEENEPILRQAGMQFFTRHA